MWTAIRLLFAGAMLLYRLVARFWPARRGGELPSGVPYFVRVRKGKSEIVGFRIGTPIEAPWFRLHKEHVVDRRFKALGLSTELQTGDRAFDQEVYVAGDHPSLHHLLSTQPALRDKIREVFENGFERVTSVGGMLWLAMDTNRMPSPYELHLLDQLRALMLPIEGLISRRLPHPFWWTALIVETVIWSMFGYAIPCALEAFGHKHEHLFKLKLVAQGLLLALVMFALLLGAIVVFLRRSSRGHRLIVESALLLLFSLPVIGTQLVADLNRDRDHAPTVKLVRKVNRVERRKTWFERGRWYSYHLYVDPARGPEPIALPTPIEVPPWYYDMVTPQHEALIEIGPGWLGHPWYRQIWIRRL